MNKEIEDMKDFFNLRAVSYDNHMKENINNYTLFYEKVSKGIKPTNEKIIILDLGCGTGLELNNIFKKCPNTQIDCLDLSKEMLEVLKEKYKRKKNQINLIVDSYLDYEFKKGNYNYIISVMTVHHLLYETKYKLYKKIYNALKPGGIYIEGDYIVNQSKEIKLKQEYLKLKERKNIKEDGTYHIDIPFSIKTEKEIFDEVGFNNFKLYYNEDEAAVYSIEK